MQRITPCHTTSLAIAALALLAASACSDTTTQSPTTVSPSAAAPRRSADGAAVVGGVFVTTNGAEQNAVVAFARAADGSLTKRGEFPTGGKGTGGTIDPLASQFALTLDADANRLYVVNAGSHTVATFAVAGGDLSRLAVTPSGGEQPVSVAVSGRRLFALNAASNSIAEFALGADGVPASAPLATAALGAPASGASTIRVSPDGRHVVVTERDANAVDVFTVGADGALSAAVTTHSSGDVPFGFTFTPRGQLVVSEANGAAPNGAASTYALRGDGALVPLAASVSARQAATCWIAVDGSGRFAYLANAGSGSISGYRVGADGSLALLDADGRTGIDGDGATPLDLQISRDGRFLYVLEAGTGTIGAFAVGRDGGLTALADTPGLVPASGLQGLAAY